MHLPADAADVGQDRVAPRTQRPVGEDPPDAGFGQHGLEREQRGGARPQHMTVVGAAAQVEAAEMIVQRRMRVGRCVAQPLPKGRARVRGASDGGAVVNVGRDGHIRHRKILCWRDGSDGRELSRTRKGRKCSIEALARQLHLGTGVRECTRTWGGRRSVRGGGPMRLASVR
jgi:hypothetical protein